MKHLLDTSVLLAAIWKDHQHHATASAWLSGKAVLLCPIAELGFLRISTQPKAINAPMETARELLERFARERKAERIADDLPALESHPAKSEHVTDLYLAHLAEKHGARLATFDRSIPHRAVDLVA
jgi:toxin-antitoxin system PIN domain toxin